MTEVHLHKNLNLLLLKGASDKVDEIGVKIINKYGFDKLNEIAKLNFKNTEKIKELIAEELGADAATITAETSFKDDLHADSLDLFELAMAFEEEFSVEIPSEDLEQITTVADVMNYLTEHQA